MKLRQDRIGKHALICPFCKAPISIDFANEENKDGTPATHVPATNSPAPLPKPIAPRKSAENLSPIENLATAGSHLPPPKKEISRPAEILRGNNSGDISEESESGEKPRIPPASAKSGLPTSRTKPFEDANSNSRVEGRTLPPAEQKITEEFRSKLKSIDIEQLGKQKHRRRLGPGELRVADWDTPNLDKIPEAEISADEWSHAGQELLPEEVIPSSTIEVTRKVEIIDGQEVAKVKRIHKRFLIRGVQLLFLRMTKTVRWLILSLVAIILCTGIWYLAQVFRNKAAASASEPSAQKLSAEEQTLAGVIEQLSRDDEIGALDAIQNFLAAPNWEAKSAFVRLPEKTRPLMEKWYVTHPASPLKMGELEDIKKHIVGNGYYVFAAVRIGPENVMRYFAVEQLPPAELGGKSQYLIDWETSVGYQPIDIYDYRVKQPKDRFVFRVNCKPYEYYNHGFSNKEEWSCYMLTYPGDPDFELIGYIKRDSPLEEQMQTQLLGEVNLMLEVHYPENAISRDQVVIEKIVHPSWYVDRPGARLVGTSKSGEPKTP